MLESVLPSGEALTSVIDTCAERPARDSVLESDLFVESRCDREEESACVFDQCSLRVRVAVLSRDAHAGCSRRCVSRSYPLRFFSCPAVDPVSPVGAARYILPGRTCDSPLHRESVKTENFVSNRSEDVQKPAPRVCPRSPSRVPLPVFRFPFVLSSPQVSRSVLTPWPTASDRKPRADFTVSFGAALHLSLRARLSHRLRWAPSVRSL